MCAAISPTPNENIGSGPSSVSRSGRVRKKSSLLADYESLDGFEKPRKKHEKEKPIKREKHAPTPKVTLKIGGETRIPGKRGPKKGMKRLKLEAYKRSMLGDDDDDDDEEGDLEIDLPEMKYDMEGHLPMLASGEIIDEGLLDEEDGATEIAENTSINRLKSQAESTYFMEKKLETSRKYGAIHPGSMQSGKVKQTRKDKGSPRVTAYMLWAKEQRPHIVKKNPEADNPTIAKKLGDLWSTVPPTQKKLWKSKASKLMKKKANLGENMKNSAREARPPGRPGRKPKVKLVQEEESSSTVTTTSTTTTKTISKTSASSNIIPNSTNTISKIKQPKEIKSIKKSIKKSATPSLSTNSTLSNKTPKVKTSPKTPKGHTATSTPTTTTNISTTTNGKPMSGGGVFPKSNSKHNSITHSNRNFTPKGLHKTPKMVSQTNKNSGGINSSNNNNNNFALVSSEFTQQTNVQINKNDKKFSANKNNNLNLSTMQTSSPSPSRFLQSSPSKSQQFSPRKEEDSNMYKITGTAPLDVAAHFSLLGESLTIIGERLKEHEGQTVSGSLSVLLDSLLCATGPLLCLTQQVPNLNCIPPEQLASILDNIAYIMPGL